MNKQQTIRNRASARKIARLIERDGRNCVWCGLVLSKRDPRASCDHVVPCLHGGSLHLDNLVLACSDCNGRRGTCEPLAFLRICERDRDCCPRSRLIFAALRRGKGNPYCDRAWLQLQCELRTPLRPVKGPTLYRKVAA